MSNRTQRINNVFSSWKDLILGVSQRSVIGPLYFNIYLNNLFIFRKDVGICNFADDTTTYISDESLENVLKSLEKNSMLAIHWFENNYMKSNTDKCRLIVSGHKHEQVWTNIGKDLVWESSDVKLLGITTDRDLKFDKHVLKLCSKAILQLSALSRIPNCFLSIKEGHFLKLSWSLNLNIGQLLGCFMVDVPTRKLIGYMSRPYKSFQSKIGRLNNK